MLQPVRTQDAIEVAVKVADFPAATRPPTAAELASIVLAEKSQWPAVQGLKADGSVETGPTGSPWVNSNSAMVRALAAQHPGKQIWLPAKLPAAAQPNSAILALADAAICGGRWVASADGNIQQMRDAMEFFETHREWANWDAVAALGVISNFETSLGVEFLNLAARRQLCTRILHQDRPQGLSGLQAVIWLSKTPPDPTTTKFFVDWASKGNLVLLPFGARVAAGGTQEAGHMVQRTGAGRVAVPLTPWADPYKLAHSTHLLLSRRHDVMRLWNSGSINAFYTASADRRRAVIQLVNYALRAPAHEVTLGLATPCQRARIHTFADVRELKIVAARVGVELALPPIGVYAAIEVEL